MQNTIKIIERANGFGSQQLREVGIRQQIEHEANEFRILFPITFKEAIQNFIDNHFSSLTREEKGALTGNILIHIAMLSQFALGATLMDMVIRQFGIKNAIPKAGETIEIVVRVVSDVVGGIASEIGKHRVVYFYSKKTFESLVNFTKWFAYNFDVRQWNHINWITALIWLPVVPTTALIFGYLTPLSFVEMAHILKSSFNNKFVDSFISAISTTAVQTVPQIIATSTNLLGLGYAVKGAVQYVNDTIYSLFENPAYRKRCTELQNQLEAARLLWKQDIEDAINFNRFGRAEKLLKQLLNDDSISLNKLSGEEIQKLKRERAAIIKECKKLRKENKQLDKKVNSGKHKRDDDAEMNLQSQINKNNDELLDKYQRIKAIDADLNDRRNYVKDITDKLDALRQLDTLRQLEKENRLTDEQREILTKLGSETDNLAKKLLNLSKDLAPQSIPNARSKSENFFRFLCIAPTIAAVYGLNNFAAITKMAFMQYNMGVVADEAAWFDMIGMGALAMGVLPQLQQAASYYLFGREPGVRILAPTEEAKIYAKAHGWSVIGTFPNVCQSIIIKQPPAEWVFAFISSYLIELFAMLAIERENAEKAAKEENFLKMLGAGVDAVFAQTCNVANLQPEELNGLYKYWQDLLNPVVDILLETQPKADTGNTERYWPVAFANKATQYISRILFFGSSGGSANNTVQGINSEKSPLLQLPSEQEGYSNSGAPTYNTMH